MRIADFVFTPWPLMTTSQITLFSSIVALFILEIYKTLLPSNSPSSRAVRINTVLFLSFFLSIISAMSCALIQKWCYEYLKSAYPWAAPHECGRVRTYLFQGLAMRGFIYGTHALLHTSVFLFFWAISDFFHTVHDQFGNVTSYTLYVSAIIYILLSISPLVFSNSPCNTPLTPLLRIGWITLIIIIRSPLWCLSRNRDLTGFPYYKGIQFDRARLYSIKAEERAEKLESYAMKWLFTENVFSDKDMDMFLEGLPGYISSSHTKKGQLDKYLTADYILSRIKEHLITCATSVELSDEASIARVSSSAQALLLIFQYSPARKQDSPVPDKRYVESQLQRTYIQRLMEDFQTLCGMDDEMIALRASCIRALAVQCLLSELVPQDSRTTDSRPFRVSLIPIYVFLFPDQNLATIGLLDHGETFDESPVARDIMTMWKNLLHHGSLANLTKLAQAVRDRERAPPSTLSFCWKALDILLTHLKRIDSEESNFAQRDFDNLHKTIRTYAHEEQGFRVMRLLDILNTVARGRRLLMVFSSHPMYRNRADVVFGKDYLRNGDLLEAFAHCLPDFISKNPNTCREFMEEIVHQDNLWTSLQENLLSNTERSDADSPTPDKLRVFEHCCTVLDLAFSVLEDSREVDWRAPEFGSLSKHFESFIDHNFQGPFVIINFRVGVINARFCKALLAQFSNDLDREGTVSFRSQWDVTSLARLVRTLGLERDEEEANFWYTYDNRGHIGAEFRAKALEMIRRTECDGPLLIFCRLGHLAVMAIVLDHSGLESEDIEVVMKLQSKVIEKRRLPLNKASTTVWEELDQLRKQVTDLCDESTGKDRRIQILYGLLQLIDDVYELRSSGSEGPYQIEHAEEQGLETLAVNSTSSLGESRRISNRFGSPSEPTAVTGGPSSGTQTRTSEGEGGFGRASSLLLLRASIDLQPERPVDNVLDREMMSYGRTESSRSYELSSHSLASHYPLPSPVTVRGPGVRTMPRRSVTVPIPSTSSYFPYMGGGQNPFMRQSSSRFTPSRSSSPTLASTDVLSTSRRDAHTALPNPAASPQTFFLAPVTEDESSRPPSRL
jgi:hypothetical protein